MNKTEIRVCSNEQEFKYDVNIDRLKILAAAIVFLCHGYIACHEAFGFELTNPVYFILKTPAWAGVWIFMFLSGYNAYTTFSTRYGLSFKEIVKYYFGRFISIIIPTWIMISIIYIIVCPDMVNVTDILQFISCTYRGHGGGDCPKT